MAKPGPKELAQRAQRERRVSKPAKTVTPKRAKPVRSPVAVKKAKPSIRPQKRPLSRKVVAATTAGLATTVARLRDASGPPPSATPKKLGRPSTGFDRAAYQRVYTRLRRLHGPLKAWPPAALDQLRLASKGTPHA